MLSTNSTHEVAAAFDGEFEGQDTALGAVDDALVDRVGSWFSAATGVEVGGEAGLFCLTEVLLMLLVDVSTDGVAALHRRAGDHERIEQAVAASLNPLFPPFLPALQMTGRLDASLFQAQVSYPWLVLEDLGVASAELRRLAGLSELDQVQNDRALCLIAELVAATMRAAS